MAPVLTVTMNPALDRTMAVDRLTPREKLRCSHPTAEPGGGGINVSRVIRELGGASVPFIVAGGYTGVAVKELLQAEGLSPKVLEIENPTRESFMVWERNIEAQYRFILPGPSVSDSEWRDAFHMIVSLASGVRYAVASGSLPPGCPDDFYALLARTLSEKGVKLVLDTSGPALLAAVGAPLHVLKLDEEELRDFADEPIADEEARNRAARALFRHMGAAVIVVTLGADGALVVSEDGLERIPGQKVKAISTVGAGDCFVGAMTKALSEGRALRDACRYGVAAGTAAVLTRGTALARAEDVERIWQEMTARS